MDNPIEAFERAHKRMADEWRYSIPHDVVRAYLDFNAMIKRMAEGEWFSKRLVVSKGAQPSPELMGIFKVALEENWMVEVR